MTAIVDSVLLEASTADIDDVVRLDDRYGRHRHQRPVVPQPYDDDGREPASAAPAPSAMKTPPLTRESQRLAPSRARSQPPTEPASSAQVPSLSTASVMKSAAEQQHLQRDRSRATGR